MSVFTHGLVIGKFYPPHSGHQYLIRAAAQASRHLTVVVMAADVESIALAQRVGWLEEIFAAYDNVRITGVIDNEPIDYQSDPVWRAHMEQMRRGIEQAEALRQEPAGAVDAVFTSESYGKEMAHRLGARSVCLDPARELYPVSGTAVRRDPVGSWQHLAACVRQNLCRRVVIVGAESTGKSTLAAALAAKFRERGGAWAMTQAVAEYGREYTVNKVAIHRALHPGSHSPLDDLQQLHWESTEFETIASEQCRREDELARTSSPVLICDTDAFATGVWHERYLNRRSASVEAIARQCPPRFGYIITSWRDVPFAQDGVRDGAHLREWMHERFLARLTEEQAAWVLVTGSLEARVQQCLDWIDWKLTDAWQFAEPLATRAAT